MTVFYVLNTFVLKVIIGKLTNFLQVLESPTQQQSFEEMTLNSSDEEVMEWQIIAVSRVRIEWQFCGFTSRDVTSKKISKKRADCALSRPVKKLPKNEMKHGVCVKKFRLIATYDFNYQSVPRSVSGKKRFFSFRLIIAYIFAKGQRFCILTSLKKAW